MSKRIGVTFDEETYMQICLLAHKENKTMSELVRSWSQDALNGQLSKDNIDFITHIIREQLRDVLQPSVERLAKLNAKTCVQASAAAYLNAEAIAKFVPLDLQIDVQEAYEAARKKGIAYTKTKQNSGMPDD